ncbi:MAG: cell division protein [Gammaproteobacteria bacterium]|nr:cell division protein [Gammaproteobacteria bacterium]
MIHIWFLRHLQVAISSLGRLTRSPIGTLMTATVLGIAVSLPAGMWVMLDNVKQISGNWDAGASLSMFLKADTDEQQVDELIGKLKLMPEIQHIAYVTKDDALVEFQQFSGLGQALEILQENPLPAVLIITPTLQHSTPLQADLLLKQLNQEPLADLTQLDMEWVERFHAITEIAIRAVIVLASVLSLAVLLIIGNTIRLEIQNRHDEIEITKLVGATNSFIRRPFLYTGFWYGLLGGLIAWFLVTISLWLLSGPIEKLTGLYQSQFRLDVLDLPTTVVLLMGSAFLGLAGARIAVGRHLRAIEPD